MLHVSVLYISIVHGLCQYIKCYVFIIIHVTDYYITSVMYQYIICYVFVCHVIYSSIIYYVLVYHTGYVLVH